MFSQQHCQRVVSVSGFRLHLLLALLMFSFRATISNENGAEATRALNFRFRFLARFFRTRRQFSFLTREWKQTFAHRIVVVVVRFVVVSSLPEKSMKVNIMLNSIKTSS